MDELYIDIVEEIWGWGWDFKTIFNQTKDFKGSKIIVPINSYGGDVMEGMSIYNYLKGHPVQIEARIVGYAMSIGTIIASAADRVVMPENGWYMIHNPWMRTGGDHEDLKHSSEVLLKMTNDLADIYVKKTGLPLDRILQMMDVETWLTAKEALEYGFVDELSSAVQYVAQFEPDQLSKFRNIPQALAKGEPEIHNQNNEKDMKILAAISAFFGKEITENTTEAEIQALIAEKNQAEASRQSEIEQLRSEFQNLQSSALTEERVTTLATEAVQAALEGHNTGISDEDRTALNQANETITAQVARIDSLIGEVNALKNLKSGGKQSSGQGLPTGQEAIPDDTTVVAAPEFDALFK
jgi:ATP-dependent Clp protease, protease subunit